MVFAPLFLLDGASFSSVPTEFVKLEGIALVARPLLD